MACWKWFNTMLEEAGVEVTEENRERIDQVIHDFVSDRSSYGRCSHVIEKASEQIQGDRTMRLELIDRLQRAAAPQKVQR